MTIDAILKEIRRRLGDVDGILDEVTLDYGDDFLLEYVDSATDVLGVSMPTGEFAYTFTGSTFDTDPETIDGLLIAALAAKMIITNDVISKVNSGELGVRFRSGLDELSTVQAAKLIGDSLLGLGDDYRYLVMAKLSGRSAGSVRLQ